MHQKHVDYMKMRAQYIKSAKTQSKQRFLKRKNLKMYVMQKKYCVVRLRSNENFKLSSFKSSKTPL